MIRINLLDPESRRTQLRGKGGVLAIALVAFALATAGLLSWHHLLQRRIKEHQPRELQLQKERLVLDRVKDRIDSNQEKLRELSSRIVSLNVLNRSRCVPIEVLEAATRCLPVKRRLSLISLSQAEGRVHFRGSSLDFGALVGFVQCLEGTAIFNSANLGRWDSNRGVFDFEISCQLER